MLSLLFFTLQVGVFSQAHADCLDWNGLSSTSHPILDQTKHVSLALSEEVDLQVIEEECVDVETCSWRLQDDIGTLQQETGPKNVYTAPSALNNCEVESTILILECFDGDGESFMDLGEITITCGEDIDDSNPSFWSASGGGCNSPAYALFVPLFHLTGRRRRKN